MRQFSIQTIIKKTQLSAMDQIETAGQIVLLHYGKFLDNLSARLLFAKENFPPFIEMMGNHASVEVQFEEHSCIFELMETDNKIQNKVLVIFSTICKEVSYLEKEAVRKYLPNLLYYGESCSFQNSDEQLNLMANELLVQLLDVLSFVRRCRYVLVHFLQQLANTFSIPQKYGSDTYFPIKFQDAFHYLGNILVILVALDIGVSSNTFIESHYNLLKMRVLSTLDDGMLPDVRKLKLLNQVLGEIHTELFTGQIFQNSINAQLEKKIYLGNLGQYFNSYLKNLVLEIESKKDSDANNLKLWPNAVATYVLNVYLFGITDKKLHKSIIDISRKCISTPVYNGILWLPGDFLSRHLESRARDQTLKVVMPENISHTYLDNTGLKLTKEVRKVAYQTFVWSLNMENSVSLDLMSIKFNDDDTVHLCFEGLQLSRQIKLLISDILNFHSSLNKPMGKALALNLCKLMELLKGILSIFNRHQMAISKCLNHSLQKMVAHILNVVLKKKKDLIREKSCTESQVDSYSSLVLAEQMLFGACTVDRLLLSRLALTITNHIPLLYGESNELAKYYNKLLISSSLMENIQEATTCHFLYRERQILSIYLKHLMDCQSDLTRLQYVLSAWEDSFTAISPSDDMRRNLFAIVNEELQMKVLKNLCQEIETNLRLHVHSHLNHEADIPISVRNFRSIIRTSPFYIFKNLFCIKGHIEGYLDKTFYDLTTVALHDWHTYKKMRSLAEQKFCLFTVEDNLPSQALFQGLDVLEIMRNINVFVSKYLYNLNNQCFIENANNNKHLNTININQIANSIWTHGIGIMNTTANFVYQFLRRKLLIFSQFLYDDNIKFQLMKDFNYFFDNISLHGTLYPFDRAEKFNKNISRLGVTKDGLTYLDQYRILISQIGNALAYVRMVRAGGLHYCLGSSVYLPSHDLSTFSTQYLAQSTSKAVVCFHQILTNMFHNLNGGSDYFKLLVDVFINIFYSPENSHLKLFVMIIPPLTINFVRYIVAAKEKMSKRNRDGAFFTDDGFAMGLAYLLQVLDLNEEFDAIHWFESVREKYKQEELLVLKRANCESKEFNHENTVKLSTKRLHVYRQEFDLLQYSLESARVFFRENAGVLAS